MERQTGNLAKIAIFFIGFYRRIISPWIFPCCRFTPTCSEYAQDALRKHGFIVGSSLAAWRLIRCNPFCRPGYDPVPENIRFYNICKQKKNFNK